MNPLCRRPWLKIAVLLCVVGIILECKFLRRIVHFANRKILSQTYNSHLRSPYMLSIQTDKAHELELSDQGYVAAVYYSNWSPYPPRNHFPHEIDFRQITHVFYSFFLVDPKSGQCKSSDEYSDSQLDVYKQMTHSFHKLDFAKTFDRANDSNSSSSAQLPQGCIGELFYLKYTHFLPSQGGPAGVNNFKTVMSVGGWSNRDAFEALVKDSAKLNVFVESCVDNMFKYGFDGIDIDWEFPKNDSREPVVFLEMMKALRSKLLELEDAIFGSAPHSQHFLLTAAISGDTAVLEYLPLAEANQYLDYFNLMAYDFSGGWSERTSYQSNLYDASSHKKPSTDSGVSADKTVQSLIHQYKVPANKIVLGMPAYGRGFRKVSIRNQSNHVAINRKFHGVQGTSKGEKGMSLYKSLPAKGNQEFFDSDAVSAFCMKPWSSRSSTDLTVYDNPASMLIKAQYVRQNELAGGFWWDSCGEDYINAGRSLTRAFTQELKKIKKTDPTIYRLPQVARYYKIKYDHGFLTPIFSV
ncbi:LAME_0D03114g1_1 [Lachancea meyersii CBS 8951]|uniref:chitinase n=1 Tax=Lachancea meyersii CBS 8951 TaxID=1266667 RepID=A0A1G4J870_9SACH|nr:LAME_0D03114g1_1 [Lachancea meyersii CBS 8951]